MIIIFFVLFIAAARAFLLPRYRHPSHAFRLPATASVGSSIVSDEEPFLYNGRHQSNTPLAFQHDYTISPAPASTFATNRRTRKSHDVRVFCDLDGVLTDFEAGVRKLFPDSQAETFVLQDLHRSKMWEVISSDEAFFEHLPWTPNGRKLWQAIQPLQPDILTGVPTYKSSRREKFRWCRRELGVNVAHIDAAGHFRTHVLDPMRRQDDACNVITCWSENKHYESGPGRVLIDDRESLRPKWEVRGGIFIHHNGNVDETIEQLRYRGILS